MRRRTLFAVGLLLALSASRPSPAVSAGISPRPVEITADLDGAPILATEAGRYFCHDFEFPHLRCFSTSEALDAEVAAAVAASDDLAIASNGPNDYVTIYSEAGFGGAYAHLSQNYDALWVIGWNDSISSFKGRIDALGSFYVDWYAGGSRLDFCCNQTAASLSGTFNDAISSVYRR